MIVVSGSGRGTRPRPGPLAWSSWPTRLAASAGRLRGCSNAWARGLDDAVMVADGRIVWRYLLCDWKGLLDQLTVME